MAEKQRNLYGDEFTKAFEAKYGMPYASETADWVGLARLLKSELGPRLTLEVWKRGVANYLNSEVAGGHTLRHLCSRFVPYWKGALDRYGQPVQVKRNGFAQIDYGKASWVIRFIRAVNAANLPEAKREQLWALMDVTENGGLGEDEAFSRLEALRDEPKQEAHEQNGTPNEASEQSNGALEKDG